jgi:hypothetical protein
MTTTSWPTRRCQAAGGTASDSWLSPANNHKTVYISVVVPDQHKFFQIQIGIEKICV